MTLMTCHLRKERSNLVRGRIERVKYKTVADSPIFPVACGTRGLLQIIRSNSKPASFFRDRVHNLFVENLGHEELEEIISVCSGVQFLVLFQNFGEVPSLIATRPRRLSLHLTDVPKSVDSPQLPNSIFNFVTHLDLFDSAHPNSGEVVACLAQLAALTHLALWKDSTDLRDVLVRCGRLQTLVDMHNFERRSENLQSIDDVRYVCMVVSDEDYLEEWIIATRGGLDFWARADAFIAKKRRGEIKPSSPISHFSC